MKNIAGRPYYNLFVAGSTRSGKTAYLVNLLAKLERPTIIWISTTYNLGSETGVTQEQQNKSDIKDGTIFYTDEIKWMADIKNIYNECKDIYASIEQKYEAYGEHNLDSQKTFKSLGGRNYMIIRKKLNKYKEKPSFKSFLLSEITGYEPYKQALIYMHFKPVQGQSKLYLVTDDMGKLLRTPYFGNYLKMNRHLGISTIMLSQSIKDLLPESLSQLAGVVLYSGISNDSIHHLYDNISFNKSILDPKGLWKLYIETTKNKYNALVISGDYSTVYKMDDKYNMKLEL